MPLSDGRRTVAWKHRAPLQHWLESLFTSLRDGNTEIYAMDADGGNQENLTNHPAHDSWSRIGLPTERKLHSNPTEMATVLKST